MKHYAIVEMDVTDPAWVDDYVRNVTPMVEAAGGRYLSRSIQVDQLEGDGAAPQCIVLLEWPSREIADGFYESAEYKPFKEARQAGAKNRFTLIPAEDVQGLAKIP
ncbi:MAG: DUF1330 domain-containing protein [Gemmatimonadaceae bacterium]